MEYSIDFAERLIEAAYALVLANTPVAKDDAPRAILYLSRLSCELTLKALLEKAGFDIKHLRSRGHNLADLAADMCCCELTDEGSPPRFQNGSQLLSQPVARGFRDGTVGTILKAEELGASRYPVEIRYGEAVKDLNPLMVLDCARVMVHWARSNYQRVRRDQGMQLRAGRRK